MFALNDTLTLLILLSGALLLAARAYKASETHQHTASMVVSLSAVFIASAALAELFLSTTGPDTETLKRMLTNLAFFAGIPLIASALVDQAFNYRWSKAAWGRWLLVLFALFELFRRAEFGIEYAQIMSVLCIVAVLVNFTKIAASLRLYSAIHLLALTASLLLFSPFSLMPDYSQAAYHHLSLGVALAALGMSYPKACR